mmetsp:Transcript_103876/g.161959  ORF Transcript_103876/g.161959 Transcript_103876/m.161959 type:complete len:91 (-) Transcript_103876:5-277(-)
MVATIFAWALERAALATERRKGIDRVFKYFEGMVPVHDGCVAKSADANDLLLATLSGTPLAWLKGAKSAMMRKVRIADLKTKPLKKANPT